MADLWNQNTLWCRAHIYKAGSLVPDKVYEKVEIRFGDHPDRGFGPDLCFHIRMEHDDKYVPMLLMVEPGTGNIIASIEHKMVIFFPYPDQYEQWENLAEKTRNKSLLEGIVGHFVNLKRKKFLGI